MKRVFLCLLAAMLLVFPGCGKKDGEKEAKIASRYFFYEQDDKLFCLDTETQKSTQITGIETPITDVSAKLSKDGKTIVFVMGEGLYRWDVGSKKAQLIDTGVAGCMGSETMDTLLYSKEEQIDEDNQAYQVSRAYLYTKDHGTTQVSTMNSAYVSVSDDGNSILMEEIDISRVTDFENQTSYAPTNLYRIAADGSKEVLADVIWYSTAASADHSTICYLKKEGEPIGDYGPSWPAYQWTEQGEKRLPFEATEMMVFGADEIYYSRKNGEGWDQYYFDGKESHLLAENGLYYGGKAGDHFYIFQVKTADEKYEQYVAYQGKTVIVPGGYYNTKNAAWGGLSYDRETLYVWAEKEAYAVRMENNELTCTSMGEVGEFTPRRSTVSGGNVLQNADGVRLNGELISANGTEGGLSIDGNYVAYREGDALYRYSNQETTKISDTVSGSFYALDDGNVLYYKNWQEDVGGTLCIGNGKKENTVGDNIQVLGVALPWPVGEMGNMVVSGKYEYMVRYSISIGDYIVQKH